jgi:hypothetical protein
MQDETPDSSGDEFGSNDPQLPAWERKQVYFVTIEWLDEPHQPSSPEPLAQAIRHTLEHAHTVAAGTPPARFTVRVKADTVAAEVEGTVEHHHHHHQHG